MMAFPKYENYRDSRVEWLGKIPSHWNVKRNLGLFDERKEVNQPDMELLSVTIEKGVTKQSEILTKKDSSNEDKSKYKIVHRGDLAYNKMRMWQGAIGMSDYDGIVSPAYIILNTRNKSYSKYFHYLYRTELFIREANRHSYGLCSDMNSLRYEDFKIIYSPVPPEEEAKRIVEFLDRKTSEIDQAIAKKQRLIELLQEQKAILINQAVTKGLNSNVPMRDSGVEWLGEIPKHWSTTKIKHIARFISGGTPSKEKIEFWDGDIPWVSPKDMKQRYIDDSEDKITQKALQKTTLQLLNVGTLLVVVRGMILARKVPIALTRVPTTINQDMKALVINDICLPEYLLSLLEGVNSTLSILLEESGHGTKTFPTEKLGNFVLPIPPKDEQVEIIQSVKENERQINSFIEMAVSQISLLEELKRITIAEAVTGKIKV